MITIVFVFQFCQHLVFGQVVCLAKLVDAFLEVVHHLPFRNTAYRSIFGVHGDVFEVVDLREDAELRELGDARDKDEAEVLIQLLQRRIKRLQQGAHRLEPFAVVEHGEQRRIVLVDEDDDLQFRLPGDVLHQFAEPYREVVGGFLATIRPLKILQLRVEVELTFLDSTFLDVAEVEVEHGIVVPLLLQTVYGEPFEQLFLT